VTGNLNLVETAAAELPRVGLDDALTILSHADPRSARAAAGWMGRLLVETLLHRRSEHDRRDHHADTCALHDRANDDWIACRRYLSKESYGRSSAPKRSSRTLPIRRIHHYTT
jgi:hypothetical protein